MIPLNVASTSIVASHERGKFGGLFNMVESVGRTLGPASFSITYAWSISPSSFDWVDYRLVFYISAAVMALITVLVWRVFTLDILTKPAELRASTDDTFADTSTTEDAPVVAADFVTSPDKLAKKEANMV